MMTEKRKAKLFDELVYHLLECVGNEEDARLSLDAIGFTEEEIEVIMREFIG